MATSDNPFVPSPETNIDSPEIHRHEVPIVNIEEREDREQEIEKEINIEFDEDDALFTKRTNVKDSHNR
jgi:hypothetical protein